MKAYTPIPPDREEKVLGLFTRDAAFYRTFFPLLLTIALQQLAALTVNLVDNLMLGVYSELALSGATLVNQLQFVLQQIAAGIGLGIVVLASQYWGQGRTEPIKRIIAIGMKFGFAAGLVFFLLTTLLPRQVLSLFTEDGAVIEEGLRYLSVMRWTYLLFALSNSLMYAFQSVETALIGTLMSLSTILINACLNYLFIYGNLGAPELGVTGAAFATVVSRAAELLIILVYALGVDKKLRMKLRDLLGFDRTYLGDYVKVSTPVIVSGLLWGIAQAAQTAVLGHIGAQVIAANSIAVTVSQVFAVFGMATANVASVVTGKTVGEGRLEKVRAYSKTMQGIFLALGLVLGALLFLFKDPILGIYRISEETRSLTRSFLTILSVTTVGSCYEYPVEGGIIGGGGSTRYAAVTDNLFMWLFTIPSAVLSAFVFHFPPAATYCFLKADQLLKCIPNGITVNRYRWVKILTR
jgi:putative MATE family efflux protein